MLQYGMPMGDDPLIAFRRVSVARGATRVLHAIDLTIGVGEHVAILGPNGSGKSTLVKTITRECYPLFDPGSSLSILGRSDWDVFELRDSLGIVSNDFVAQCTGGYRGRDVVLSGFFSTIGLWRQRAQVTSAMEAAAAAAMARLEVGHLGDRAVAELSTGEARRIVIARAMVHEPRALLLDEPATSLDLFAQREVRRSLRAMAGSGVGLVLVTHQLGDIIPEIERVVLMKDGRIVGDGPKELLLTAERLGSLFGVEVEVARRDGHYYAW